MENNVAEYFNEYKLEYGTKRISNAVSFIKEHANHKSTLIDIGCGAGNILEYITKETKIKNISGIDISEVYIKNARERLNCEIFLGSILDKKFIESIQQKYDFVLLFATLHHLIGKSRKESRLNAKIAIQNTINLLKNQGYLIILEPTYYPSIILDIVFYIKLLTTKITSKRIPLFKDNDCNIGEPIVSFYTKEDLERMIEAADGKIVAKMIQATPVSKLMRLIGITRTANATLIVKIPGSTSDIK